MTTHHFWLTIWHSWCIWTCPDITYLTLPTANSIAGPLLSSLIGHICCHLVGQWCRAEKETVAIFLRAGCDSRFVKLPSALMLQHHFVLLWIATLLILLPTVYPPANTQCIQPPSAYLEYSRISGSHIQCQAFFPRFSILSYSMVQFLHHHFSSALMWAFPVSVKKIIQIIEPLCMGYFSELSDCFWY